MQNDIVKLGLIKKSLIFFLFYLFFFLAGIQVRCFYFYFYAFWCRVDSLEHHWFYFVLFQKDTVLTSVLVVK